MSKKVYSIMVSKCSYHNSSERVVEGTLDELISYFRNTLETGKSYEWERGNKKINLTPKTVKSLVINLDNAKNNAAANGVSQYSYSLVD